MDFIDKKLSSDALVEIKALIIEGLVSYQPFVFCEDLEVGVGYEFEEGRYAGLVHFPDMPEHLKTSPGLARRLLPATDKAAFRAANRRLAAYYDFLVQEISAHVGGAPGNTFLDVGCNTGYIPLSFSKAGAREAAGCDRQDFSKVFRLLNGLADTRARFVHAFYDPPRHAIEGVEPFDVVTSMAMVCHVADPLHLLASLGRLARRAVFVWTLVSPDDGYLVRYGEPRGDYPLDYFPYCFDNMTVPSAPLLRRSFELMGFAKCIEIKPPDGTAFPYAWKGYPFRGFLALRG